MRKGDSFGWLGVLFFIVSFFVTDQMSSALGVLGLVFICVGAWRGSKKWLYVLAALLLMIGTMYWLMAHRD